MAVLSTKNLTLADIAKRTDPNGKIDKIVEILNETNEILDDMTWMVCNDGTSHKSTVRTGLPEPTWRKLYGGVQPTKSNTAQIVDSTGNMEAYAESDKDVIDLNDNKSAARLTEDRGHIEGMNQEFANTLFYGNEGTDPAEFTGLAPRYNDTSAASGDNIILGGGSGSDNTSIWLIVWGDHTAHGLYPKGSKAGLNMEDKGQITIEDADGSGGRMEAYRSHYKWQCGLAVKDWRYIVRIANIDVSDLTKDASAGADLLDLMDQALELVPNLGGGKAAFYCNRTIRSFLRRQMKNHGNMNLTLETIAGKKVVHYDEVPVRRCDAILNTEATIS